MDHLIPLLKDISTSLLFRLVSKYFLLEGPERPPMFTHSLWIHATLFDPEGVMSPVNNGFHHVAFCHLENIGQP